MIFKTGDKARKDPGNIDHQQNQGHVNRGGEKISAWRSRTG
jgi:hypothetical protein